MKAYQNLIISGNQTQRQSVVEHIEANLSDGWARNTDIESQMRAAGMMIGFRVCFTRSANDDGPGASLWLTDSEAGQLHVSNIVPESIRTRLTRDEYNQIIEEFYSQFVDPACEQVGAQALLTGAEESIDDYLTSPTLSKLRAFSSIANRVTASSHASDQQRWQEFIHAAHEENSQLDSHTLARWLCEEEGWPEAVAFELAKEYEFGRSLLSQVPASA